MKKYPRKYEKKLQKSLPDHRDFMIDRLRAEWDGHMRAARHKEIVENAKASGAVAVKALLTLLVVGGVLTVSAIAPNMFSAVGHIAERKGFFEKKRFKASVKYLKTRKYVTIAARGGGYEMRLTREGEDFILKKSLHDLQIPRPAQWDGMWRVVIFDIPDRHKWARDALRDRLRAMEFYLLQESVFVFPYPCEKEVMFLADLFSISRHVRIISAKEIFHDHDLREHFFRA